ncbi:MAG TPA: hypothetical protein VHZ01_02005 [Casimicrobiaceae bacterium]|nr:hypothetical protein [Casimicrobiaceae bacterium]
MTERVDTATPAAQAQPWIAGAGLLVAGIAVSLLLVAIVHSGGNWRDGPMAITVDGGAFALVRGRGHRDGREFVLEATDGERLAVLSARVPPFAADGHPRVDFDLHSTDALPVDLVFVWRTEERPNRNFSRQLTWTGTHIAPLELGPDDGWIGTVAGVALVARGALPRPLVLQSFSVPSVSIATVIGDIFAQWAAFIPIVGASVTLPFDDERSHYATLLATVAGGAFFAAALYWLLARRAVARDPRVYWAIFVAGWLILDARFQVNLWRQLARTAATFAGRTGEEKRLASDDRGLYLLMKEVTAALPPPPVRIQFIADDRTLRERGSYFLYPQNVYYSDAMSAREPVPDELRSGDYALLFLTSDLAYDRATQLLVWRDGRRKPAEEILSRPQGLVLVRVR